MTRKSIHSLSSALMVLSALLLALHFSPAVGHAQSATISKVLVVQALGNQSNKYVAGKDTAILVYLSAPTAVDAAQQNVQVNLAGATVATLQPTPSSDQVSVLNFVCPSRAACGDWKAGDYTFTATVNGATAQATATFTERKKLNVLALPVKANYGPGDVRSPTGAWRTMGDYLRSTYPVSADGINWTIGNEVDASGDQFNLKTEAGQEKMFMEVVKVQPQECLQTPRPTNIQCPDKVVAFVKDRMGAEGTMQGFTMGANTNIIVESDQDARATVAHEVGHNYDLGDEYDKTGQFNCDANPPPASFVGINIKNQQKPYSCPNSTSQPFPNAPGGGASLISAATDVPYETGGRGVLSDMASFMGSGAPQSSNWISAPAWARIFDGLNPAQAGSYSVMSAQEEETRWIYVHGFIRLDDTVDLSPWYDYDEEGTQANTSGMYTLQAVDEPGNVLASTDLNINFNVVDAPRTLTRAIFDEVMPFPDGTTMFRIVKGTSGSTKVLKEVPVSENAPTVRVLSPAGGEAVNGNSFTVKWEGSDPDGDKLYYDLEYSTDNENWDLLESDLTATQITEDFTDLAGTKGATARFRVTATDGVNATEAVSEPFSVAPKAPDVDIDNPIDGAIFSTGSLVALSGAGYDLQDDELAEDTSLVWTSSLQGELGRGELLNLTNLKPGKHAISLKATNSFGLSSTATVNITVQTAPSSTPGTGTGVGSGTGQTPPGSGGSGSSLPAASTPTSITGPGVAPMPTGTAEAAPGQGGQGTITPGMPKTGVPNSTGENAWAAVALLLVVVGATCNVLSGRRKGEQR